MKLAVGHLQQSRVDRRLGQLVGNHIGSCMQAAGIRELSLSTELEAGLPGIPGRPLVKFFDAAPKPIRDIGESMCVGLSMVMNAAGVSYVKMSEYTDPETTALVDAWTSVSRGMSRSVSRGVVIEPPRIAEAFSEASGKGQGGANV